MEFQAFLLKCCTHLSRPMRATWPAHLIFLLIIASPAERDAEEKADMACDAAASSDVPRLALPPVHKLFKRLS
jgi:hypothetical protein